MAASSSHCAVHRLWPPPKGNQRTEMDVVFFHGLQLTANDSSDAWSSTWTQQGHDDVCWPQEWLPFDLREAVRIFSVSYNAHVVTSPHDHVFQIAHNLFQTLINPRYKWHHRIVLIGHSFGGLVLKRLVVKLKRASNIQNPTNSWSEATVQCAKVFLRNVRGVAFYAVPHAGSRNFAEYVNKLLRCNERHHSGIMENIQPLQRDMEQLSVDFDNIVNENKINIYAFCEGRPMEQVGILVDFSSAQQSAGGNWSILEDADHMEVCKPPSKEHLSYNLLKDFILICGKVARECDQLSQEVHYVPESTFGLESYAERVETLVTSEGRNAAPRYVGVWGMGGVGKTLLLLTLLYLSPKVRGHFQGARFLWLTVGQTPDIMRLYRILSKQLGLRQELYVNPEDYKRYLHTQFIQKRVFLVLDDVWHNEAFDSLDLAKGDGSVTLLSTRNQSLLERASPHICQVLMTPLSKEDSWSLFCVHAFRPPSNVPCELRALAQCMVEECQGLPLALKVIGRAMFGKTSPVQWKLLLKKLRQSYMQESSVEEELYERLKLGYDLLLEDDWRLKDCFLYFAAFPENSEMDFQYILWHWIGEGLVPAHDGDDPTAHAFSLLKKLWESSLIESHREVLEGGRDLLMFKVHDVMRDLAFYILEKDGGTPPAKQLYFYRAGENLEEIPEECTAISDALRLSLDTNKLGRLPESFYAPKLVSLLLGRNPIEFVPASFLSNFPKLRVLDLSYGQFYSLPEELGDLKDLVCLDLSDCDNLQILPDAVGKLYVLKCLSLCDCRMLNYLPSGVVGLTSLQVLCTTLCYNLAWAEHTPSCMARAESLGHVYPTIGASLEDICGLVALTELSISGETDPVVELPHNISVLVSNLVC